MANPICAWSPPVSQFGILFDSLANIFYIKGMRSPFPNVGHLPLGSVNFSPNPSADLATGRAYTACITGFAAAVLSMKIVLSSFTFASLTTRSDLVL